jgi:hypothetical protein
MRYLVAIAACALFAAPSLTNAQSTATSETSVSEPKLLTGHTAERKSVSITPHKTHQSTPRATRSKTAPQPLTDPTMISSRTSEPMMVGETPVAKRTEGPTAIPTQVLTAQPTNDGGK